jgi:hypothetical protein
LREDTDHGRHVGLLGSATRKLLSAGYSAYGHYPDEYVGWVQPATDVGVRAVTELGAHAILSSCPPTTAHLVGSAIARRSGAPWVALFGDLFGFYVGDGDLYTTPWRRFVARALNRRWMQPASRVAAVSPAMVDYLRRTYGVPGDVVVVGFDPDEKPARRRDAPVFRLVYTGSLYPGDQRHDLLFDALDVLIERRPELTRRLEVELVGTRRDAELRALLSGRPAASVCRITPHIDPDEAIALQHSADALLVFNLTNRTTVHGTLSYPSKIFEYLNARRPILAIPEDPGGWVTRVLHETDGGASCSSPPDVAAQLERWLDEWVATGSLQFRGNAEAIGRFSYEAQAGKLARLLDEATAERVERQQVAELATALRCHGDFA